MWAVVEEHLDEAAFFLNLFEQGLDSPVYTMETLRKGPEARFWGHVDALVVGGAPVFDGPIASILRNNAETTRSHRTVAALVVIETLSSLTFQCIHEGLGACSEFMRAVVLVDRPWIDDALLSLVSRADNSAMAPWLGACLARGMDLGPHLKPLLTADDPSIRDAAFRLLQYSDAWSHQEAIAHACTSTDGCLRDAALPAALVLGMPQAARVVDTLASDERDVRAHAMECAAQFGDEGAIASLIRRLKDPIARPAVLWALGLSGRRDAADACLAWLDDDRLGPLAGEAFAAITGIDPEMDVYWGLSALDAANVDDDLPVLEDDLDRDLSLRPEHWLRKPNSEAIRAWWHQARGGFSSGVRYAYGVPDDDAWRLCRLEREPMRRRHATAFELLVHTRGRVRVQTRMATSAQLRQISAACR